LANNIPRTVYLSKFDKKWAKINLNDQIQGLSGNTNSDFLEDCIHFSSLIHENNKEKILKISAIDIANSAKIHLTYRIRAKKNEIR
jgi:methyltransferase-like protein